MESISKELDQFYTKPEVAEVCFNKFKSYVDQVVTNPRYLEPCAGTGSFYKLLPKPKLGFDLDPKCSGVKKEDFLLHKFRKSKYITVPISNPPFGDRASLAILFLNKCCEFNSIIGFLVPIQFQKFGVQSKINVNFELISDEIIPDFSFIFDGKLTNIRCCFQIWIHKDLNLGKFPNLRIQNKPEIEHKDFVMYQYNNTKEAEKVFKYDFDFAVPRQGFQDYSRKETDPNNCERKKQWILFKANSEIVLQNLLSLDFSKLSKKNTTIPGFGKADVVKEYNERYP